LDASLSAETDTLNPIHIYKYVLRGMPNSMPALAMRESTPTEMGAEVMWHYMNLDCTNMLDAVYDEVWGK
jgi:hypothetical protein